MSVEHIKEMLVSSINTYLKPIVEPTSNTVLTDSVIQTFYPLSSEIQHIDLHLGPGQFTVTLTAYNINNTIPLSPNRLDWYRISNTIQTVSIQPFTIEVSGSGTISIGKRYHGGTCSMTVPISFRVAIDDICLEAFSLEKVELKELPKIVIDFTGRPRIVSQYFSGNMLVQDNVVLSMYSLYAKELDVMYSMIEKCLLEDQSKYEGLTLVQPVGYSRIDFVRPDIFSKDVRISIFRVI